MEPWFAKVVNGRPAIRVCGDVSLENNGGFVQIAIDLAPDGKAVDAGPWQGVELDVFGNGEEYGIHLRTEDLTRPGSPTGRTSAPIRSGGPSHFAFKTSCRMEPRHRSTPVGYDALAWLRTAARLRLILR